MIICTGESLIDFVPHAERHGSLPLYRPVPGGSPFNCAIAAARLGAEVAFLGALSRDFFGDQIAAQLRANAVGEAMITRVEAPTTLAFVKRESDGSARYAFYTEGSADRSLTAAMIPQALPESAILQIGSISLIADPEANAILELARRESDRRIVAIDPNIRTSLIGDEGDYRARLNDAISTAAVLKCSHEDLAWIYPGTGIEGAARAALDSGIELVTVTRGAAGSVAFTKAGSVAAGAAPTTVADTIGAGDSFLAAVLVWLDEHGIHDGERLSALTVAEIDSMLRLASAVSAITCSRVGADPPRRSEL